MMSNHSKSRPPTDFAIGPSLSSYSDSPKVYLEKSADTRYQYLATSTIVFDDAQSAAPRILLIQRSASDSAPNKWEIPGGGCDEDDVSVLYAAARELFEESALRARKIVDIIGPPHFFISSSGKKICQQTFLVEVETDPDGLLTVKLDPKEHQQFVWATEDEIQAGRSNGIELKFTSKDLQICILEAFRYIAERRIQAKK